MLKRLPLQAWATLLLVPTVSCSAHSARSSAAPHLRLAVTTSTQDSGLLEALIPLVEQELGIEVDVLAVGSGAALKLAEAGDVDALITHSVAAEQQFMQRGLGALREPLMSNQFLLLGPDEDPAAVRDASPAEAMARIAVANARFISRGDDSGTHAREKQLWQRAGGRPSWSEYYEAGRGQAATVLIADEKDGYALCDRGTYLNLKQRLRLVPLIVGGVGLENPYHTIAVSGHIHPQVQQDVAESFVRFLVSPLAQKVIADHLIGGEPAFVPADGA